jgi:hypothetical protein
VTIPCHCESKTNRQVTCRQLWCLSITLRILVSPRPSSLSSYCSSFISSCSLLTFVYLKLFTFRNFPQFCQHNFDVFSVISCTLFLLPLTHQFLPVPSSFLFTCPRASSSTVISVCPSQVRGPALSLFLPTPPHVFRPHCTTTRDLCARHVTHIC